jgi:hypothetical protein
VSLAEIAADLTRQESLERERERLRDLLARARASAERLARLDKELFNLRRQHATRASVRAPPRRRPTLRRRSRVWRANGSALTTG